MARFVKKFAKRFLIFGNLVIANLFLIACANAWLHPAKWWLFSLLGLAFPLLLIFGFLVLGFWAILRSEWLIISCIALVLGFGNIRAFWGIHFAAGFEPAKQEGSIRVLTWNVEWFDEHNRKNKDHKEY